MLFSTGRIEELNELNASNALPAVRPAVRFEPSPAGDPRTRRDVERDDLGAWVTRRREAGSASCSALWSRSAILPRSSARAWSGSPIARTGSARSASPSSSGHEPSARAVESRARRRSWPGRRGRRSPRRVAACSLPSAAAKPHDRAIDRGQPEICDIVEPQGSPHLVLRRLHPRRRSTSAPGSGRARFVPPGRAASRKRRSPDPGDPAARRWAGRARSPRSGGRPGATRARDRPRGTCPASARYTAVPRRAQHPSRLPWPQTRTSDRGARPRLRRRDPCRRDPRDASSSIRRTSAAVSSARTTKTTDVRAAAPGRRMKSRRDRGVRASQSSTASCAGAGRVPAVVTSRPHGPGTSMSKSRSAVDAVAASGSSAALERSEQRTPVELTSDVESVSIDADQIAVGDLLAGSHAQVL